MICKLGDPMSLCHPVQKVHQLYKCKENNQRGSTNLWMQRDQYKRPTKSINANRTIQQAYHLYECKETKQEAHQLYACKETNTRGPRTLEITTLATVYIRGLPYLHIRGTPTVYRTDCIHTRPATSLHNRHTKSTNRSHPICTWSLTRAMCIWFPQAMRIGMGWLRLVGSIKL